MFEFVIRLRRQFYMLALPEHPIKQGERGVGFALTCPIPIGSLLVSA